MRRPTAPREALRFKLVRLCSKRGGNRFQEDLTGPVFAAFAEHLKKRIKENHAVVENRAHALPDWTTCVGGRVGEWEGVNCNESTAVLLLASPPCQNAWMSAASNS